MAKEKKNVIKESRPKQKPEEDASKAAVNNIDFLDRSGNKAVLFAVGLIALAAFIVLKDYLLFEKVYLFRDIANDTIQGLYPSYCLNADYLHRFGLPNWSFSSGMGQNIFAGYLWDPFNIFFYIAGKDHLMYGMVYKELAKILITGFLFYKYLKILNLSNYVAVTGSVLLSFCGFIIVGGEWNVFSTEAFEFVFLLFAFELLFTKRKWYLFPLPVFLICISMPFNLYVYGFFLAGYTVLRLFHTGTFSAKNALSIFAKMIGLGVIGMLLSAPFFIENIFQLLESPRGSGNTSFTHSLSSAPKFAIADKIQLGTSVMRFFSNDMLGTGNVAFRGWNNFLEAPMFYCGLPCLILMPQVFPFLEKRLKIIFIVFISMGLLPIIFPYFRYAFWLFTGDYFRGYSFFIAFVFLYYSLHALELIVQKRKINLVVLIVTVSALFLLLNYPFFPGKDAVDHSISNFVSGMIIAYGVLLFFIGRQGSPAFLKYVFLGAILFELIHLSDISSNERDALTADELSQKAGYNDYSVDAVNYIKHHDGSFYRIDKTYGSSPAYYPSLNDGMVQDYYGTSSYNSFNQEYYVKYLQLMGIANKGDEHDSRWARGLINWPILESENSVKYILTKTRLDPVYDSVCDSVATFGNVKVYRNKLLVPFGFTNAVFIKESIFDSLTTTQKQFVSLAAFSVQDKDVSKITGLKEFQLKDTVPLNAMTFDVYRQGIRALSKDTLVIEKFGETLISGKIDVNEDRMIYMSIPYDGGWRLKVDGATQDKILLNGGMTGVYLKRGAHTVEMAYILRFFKTGLFLSLLGAVLYIGLWFFIKKYRKNEPGPTALT